jgi:signal transduction histidine kinase
MSKNIVRPLKALTLASERIASGDLATPVGGLGSDEILKLSKSFDDMRSKLKESLERIMTQNLELENRVALRTAQIRASRQQIEDLLKKIIRSQEDERKRIARDLHDTILQDVAAFLIKLDVCKLEPSLRTVDSIDEMRQIVTNTIDNIHTVIKDLRPTILDDLGINAAIRWLMDRHLVSKGIACDFRVEAAVKRLPPAVEITVFRIVQEAMVNIARHSNARNVTVTVGAKESSLEITVVDDGGGFDFSELVRTPSENGRGLGLLGMKERASLINGRLAVISLLGVGTEVNLTVPLEVQEEHV